MAPFGQLLKCVNTRLNLAKHRGCHSPPARLTLLNVEAKTTLIFPDVKSDVKSPDGCIPLTLNSFLANRNRADRFFVELTRRAIFLKLPFLFRGTSTHRLYNPPWIRIP